MFNNKRKHTVINDEEITRMIEEKHRPKINANAVELGRTLAQKKSLDIRGDRFIPLIEPLRMSWRASISEVRRMIQVRDEEISDELNIEDQTTLNNKAIAKLNFEVTSIITDLKNIGEKYPMIRLYSAIGFFSLIAVAETILDFQAFGAIGHGKIASFVFGFSVAVTSLFGGHTLVKMLRNGKTRAQKIAIFSSITIAFGIVFYVIGSFRVSGMNSVLDLSSSGAQSSHIGVNPIFFSILNLMFFLSAAAVSRLLPNKEAQQKIQKEGELKLKLTVKKKEIKRLEEENKKLVVEGKAEIKVEKKIQMYQVRMKEWIENLYKESVGMVISEYLYHRPELAEDFKVTIPNLFDESNNNKNKTV